jgi:SSS family solute:Na+ symporter
VPAVAGRVGLITGIAVIALGYFDPFYVEVLETANIPEFHFLGLVFALIVGLMLAIGAVSPRKEPWQIVYTNEVDLTPWWGAKGVSAILFMLVVAIYVFFAR